MLAARTNWAAARGAMRGTTWRQMQREVDAPIARAPTTCWYSRTFSTCERSTRAGRAQMTAARMTTVVSSPRPKKAASTMTSTMNGKARIKSTRRMSTASTRPRW